MDQAPGQDSEPLLDGINGLNQLPAGAFTPPEPPEGLREAVLERTRAVIRARLRKRRLAVVLGLASVYAAGLATPLFFTWEEAPAPSPVPAAGDPGRILERVPEAPLAERSRLLRLAGDGYLLTRGDLERALHCYRQVLELSEPAARGRPEAGDTWLLAALKSGHTLDSRR